MHLQKALTEVLIFFIVIRESLQLLIPDKTWIGYSPKDKFSYVSFDLDTLKENWGISIFVKSKNGGDKTILSMHCKDRAVYLVHRDESIILENYNEMKLTDRIKWNEYDEEYFYMKIVYDSFMRDFVCEYTNLESHDEPESDGGIFENFWFSDNSEEDNKNATLDIDKVYFYEKEGKCKVIIGGGNGNKSLENSFEGTVVPMVFDFFLSSFCFESKMSPKDLFQFSDFIGNVVEEIVLLPQLCGREWSVLVMNEKDINGKDSIQTDYCQRFGGRYFFNIELIILRKQLLMEVKSKCLTSKGEESTLVWTEERCTSYDLVKGKEMLSCYPPHACFLCFIPKLNLTLRSDILGDFKGIVQAKGMESAEQLSLTSDDVTIEQKNTTWYINFKNMRDGYYLNSSVLPFGKNEWHDQLTKGITNVISIDNCQQRERCHDGTCFIRMEKKCGVRHCKDGSDKSICEEGFPYRIISEFGIYQVGILDYSANLRHVKDINLEDKGIGITLRFSFTWKDWRIEWYETLNQEINGSRLPFKPSDNLLFENCDGEILPKNILSSKYSHFNTYIKNNLTVAFHLPCKFLYRDFPFAKQSCKFCLRFKDCCRNPIFNGSSIVFNGSKIVGTFHLRSIKMIEDSSKFEILIQLETSPRLSNYHTLTSFIPTFLMCFIAYCSLYFSMENFAERIGLSATSLLTLVVLFTDASDRIGVTTSYSKFIDSWFIGSVTFTAIIVVVNGALHYLIWHRVYGCKCLDFSSCKGRFKRIRVRSVDINSSEANMEVGSEVTVEGHEMDSSIQNPSSMNRTEAIVTSRDGLDLEVQVTDPSIPLARQINIGARILLFIIIVCSLMLLIYMKLFK